MEFNVLCITSRTDIMSILNFESVPETDI